ncbi:MAG TPA: thiamine phosphate synthase [Thermoanaerobaculia bacterium]|nr:thiamine phosphate synthase [Thermoanaerobaculia bacterium]
MPFRLLAISDRRGMGATTLPAWAAALASVGVPAVQLREKDLPDRAVVELLRLLRRELPAARLIANGRADLAIAAGADGVHLPADGIPTAALRRRFGDSLLIGRSTHTLEEVAREASSGADYVTFGPVFASPGKGEPVGLDALARATQLGVPVLALGGIGLAELPLVATAGATGAAGIRLFQDLALLPEVVSAAGEAFATKVPA